MIKYVKKYVNKIPLSQMHDKTGITNYEYDQSGLLTKEERNGNIKLYTYDANGNLLSSTGAVSVNYAYNKANLPISQTDLSLGVTYTSSYDLGGNRRVLGETGKPDITYSYDDYGKLLSEDASSYVINYEYDNRQNRTKMSKTQQGITDVTQYTYGKNNELLRKYRYSDNVEHVTDYTYDNNGNQTEVNYFTLTDISDEESEEGETDISAGANDYTYFYEYDSFNRLKKSSGKGYVTTYAYDGNNLRQSKTSNGVATNHYYDGQDVVLDETDGNFTSYNRGLNLLSRTNQDGTQYYHFNIHGDTSALTDANGNIAVDYRYDAFGNQLKSNENDTNPFRYCGEYFDEETGFIYLRNRYYDPSIGRFITEDPANDGNNWYIYCGNNPVIFIDPLGLFDENSILKNGDKDNIDIKVLQNELKYLKYYNGEIDGIYGPKTEEAVRAYQKDNGLEVDGIVGVKTWSSMGLIYRTQADIDAGVKIFTDGLKQYKDVSVPINNALWKARGSFIDHKYNLKWFYEQVKTGGPWDIKLKDRWNETIAAETYPGSGLTQVMLYGTITTPEALGNITYGYLGTAAGFSQSILLQGGDAAANGVQLNLKGVYDGVKGIIISADSQEDKCNIIKGINWYKK